MEWRVQGKEKEERNPVEPQAELEGRSATYTFLYLSQINYMESGTNHDFARKLILRAFPFDCTYVVPYEPWYKLLVPPALGPSTPHLSHFIDCECILRLILVKTCLIFVL